MTVFLDMLRRIFNGVLEVANLGALTLGLLVVYHLLTTSSIVYTVVLGVICAALFAIGAMKDD